MERLCDILERAADALKLARQTKRAAQKELDEAAKAAKASALSPHAPRIEGPQAAAVTTRTLVASASGAIVAQPRYSRGNSSGGSSALSAAAANANGNNYSQGYEREEAQHYTDEADSEYSDEDSEEDDEEEYSDSEESDEEDEDGFDMGNEALEQVRYRLETAKIDPNSPEGTKLLDELLLRLQDAKEDVIDAAMVNEFIDELLFETEEQTNGAAEQHHDRKPPPPQNPKHPQHPRTRINRGGKVLGWYQGQLDERGYARKGSGSMYYDAGHECHGTWENDEMIGRGIYQWSDGHVYDGEWLNGKRHGLGRFIRPDNVILYGRYEKGHHKGEGVRWSADRREAQMVVDGVPKKSLSLAKAKEIATNLGFDDVVPPV